MNWQEIIQNYIVRHSDTIQKITKPLREKLDVGYFTYHRIDSQGKYTVLVDRPDWAEHYVEQQYYLEDPYLRHPNVYQSGFCSLQSNGSDEYKEKVLRNGKEIFNLDYNILLIKKDLEAVEFFGFAANRGKSRLEEISLNCPSYLEAFAVYFKKELSSILHHMQDAAGSLVHLKGQDFFTKDAIHPVPKISSLLEEIGMGALVGQVNMLSSQEKKCLQGIGLGKSAKEIAQDLKLSHRTVESYIEHIKAKTSCFSKSELFTLARALENLALLGPAAKPPF